MSNHTRNSLSKGLCRNAARLLLTLLLAFVPLASVLAQPMKDVWRNMPDSLFPYLNRQLRTDALTLWERNLSPEVSNLLHGKTTIDTLASDYMAVSLTECSSLQMRLLPRPGNDSVLCVICSYSVPESDSRVTLYTKDWKSLAEVSFDIADFVSRPDTMTVKRYEELLKLFDPYLVSADASSPDGLLSVSVAAASLPAEEREAIASILSTRKCRWTGEEFELLR